LPDSTKNQSFDPSVVGVGAGGRTVLIHPAYSAYMGEALGRERRGGPVELRDIATGKVLGSFLDGFDLVDGAVVSPDGRWCAVPRLEPRSVSTPRLFDVATCRADMPLPTGNSVEPRHSGEFQFSTDSTLLAYESFWDERKCITLWDLAAARERCVLRDATFPMAFSGNGQIIAVTSVANQEQPTVSAYETANGRIVKTFSRPPSMAPELIALNTGGSRVVVTWIKAFNERLLQCHDLPAGTLRFEVSLVERCYWTLISEDYAIVSDRFTPGQPHVICWREITSGNMLTADTVDESGFVQIAVLSPNGRNIACPYVDLNPHILERLARSWGLPWPEAWSQERPGIGLWDAATGKRLGDIAAPHPSCRWCPDSQSLAVIDGARDHPMFQLWDVPPRKSLGWFAVVGGLIALPVAVLAGWRVRRLTLVRPSSGQTPPAPVLGCNAG
jgi:hypothetical protein